MSAPIITLDAADAVELAEILEFVGEWLGRDFTTLRASLDRFSDHSIAIDDLRDDLARFGELIGDARIYSRASR